MNLIQRAAALFVAMALLVTAAACSQDPDGESSQPTTTAEDSAISVDESTLTAANTWDPETAVNITFDGDTITVDGEGAKASGNILRVTSGGTYALTGRLTGSVVVEAPKTDTVQLVLNGVDIQADQNAAIYCSQADELVITLADGTENSVTDASDYTYEDTTAEEPDAAIFCKDDLTIGGTGSLTVNAGFNNGIGTKDDLVIVGGEIAVTSANHGIRGRDSVTVTDGVFTIRSGNDGIQSNNDEDAEKGWIALQGGSYDIESANDAIQAETALTITGGTYRLVTGGGSNTTPADAEGSYKGLKASTAIIITGGTFDIDGADDAIHSNGDIAIGGGAFTIATGDDGVHADGDLTITDCDLTITTSYEGLEAVTMTISGGSIDLVASDDGINIAGGNDSTGEGHFGPDSFSSGSEDRWLLISGGTIYVNAQGDGIDVNGSATMTGGMVYVDGPTSGGNGALDYDGTFEISGGTLVAAGSTGMAQSPSASSTQPVLALYYSSQQEAGTVVDLADSGGNVLASHTPAKSFQMIIFSTPDMQTGQTYTVNTGGSKTIDTTLSDAVTSISDTGEAVSGMFGRGGMGGGGMGGRGGGGGTPPEMGERPQRQEGQGGFPPGGSGSASLSG